MDTVSGYSTDDESSSESPVQTVDKAVIVPTITGVKRKPPPPPIPASRKKTPVKSSIHKATALGAKHPNYRSMITAAIASKTARNGVSFRAITNYINSTYEVGSSLKFVNTHAKKSLTKMVEDGVATLVTGTVGTGYFKLGSSQKAKTTINSNVKTSKTDEKKPIPAKSKPSTSNSLNSTFTKTKKLPVGASKSLAKNKSLKNGKPEPNSARKAKVISVKRKSVLTKIMNRASLLQKRNSISKVSPKTPDSKNLKPKSSEKLPAKSVLKTKIIKPKPITEVVSKSPNLNKGLSKSKTTKATKSKPSVQN